MRAQVRLPCVLAATIVLAFGGAALARPGKLAKAGKAKAPAAHAAPARKAAAPAVAPAQAKERTPSASAPAPAESSDGDSAGDDTATKPAPGGGKMKTKSYSFGAMDVEGKLKTPQLLYFLDRVKLELDMSAPDKRSFMKELEKSADDKSL